MSLREIVGSRGKTLLRLGISLALLLLACGLVSSPDGDGWIGWFSLVMFGIGTLVFGWLLIRPQRLTLDAEGFVLSGGLMRSPRRVRWCDMTGFFVHRLPRGGRMIGYNLVDAARPTSALSRVSHHLGVDAMLPKSWPGRPEQIVADLNDYRARALGIDARAV